MKKLLLLSFCVMAGVILNAQQQDWANYGRYARDNAELRTKPDVVFMGNSITEGWVRTHPGFFTDNNYIGRGISGQVTAQMLARFRSDVIDLSPKVVVILAGTNDIALNNGHISLEHICQNIASMCDLAEYNGIRPVLCSVIPASGFGWRPEVTDAAQRIRVLNDMIEDLAKQRNYPYVDYHAVLDDGNGGLSRDMAEDGVHPTAVAYDLMESAISPVLKEILNRNIK